MAQAALQAPEEFDTGLVRRLMARPLRLVPHAEIPQASVQEAEVQGAEIVTLHQPAPAVIAADPSPEVSRLKADLMVMKAVLGAERRESERLRECLTQVEDAAPLGPEAQAVRDRWAALVDQLLHMPR